MGTEQTRVTPDMTHVQAINKGLRYFAKKIFTPVAVSMASQDTVIAVEKKFFAEPMKPIEWLKGTPYTEKLPFLGTSITTLLTFAGAFLGEHLVAAKEKVGLKPDNKFKEWIWHGSIVTQFAAAAESLGKIAFQAPEIWNHMTTSAWFFMGDLAAIAGGVIAVADNRNPQPEDRNDIVKNMWLPALGLILGVGGYILAPVEDKPAMAGMTVAALANFIENAEEIDWKNAIKNEIAKANTKLAQKSAKKATK